MEEKLRVSDGIMRSGEERVHGKIHREEKRKVNRYIIRVKTRERSPEGTEGEGTGRQGSIGIGGVEEGLEERTSDTTQGMKEEVIAKQTEEPETSDHPEETGKSTDLAEEKMWWKSPAERFTIWL